MEEQEEEGLDESHAGTPALALTYGTIKSLAYYLDPHLTVGCYWKGLADKMGYDYQFIRNLEGKASPTEELLGSWMKKPAATCGMLIHFLKEVGREDALDDTLSLIVNDIESYRKRANSEPGQQGGFNARYDAFVSYAPEDFGFVRELMIRLEEENNFRLCIADRDILVGESAHTVTAKLIDECCKRVIIVISKNYTNSDECDWQLKFAHALAPGAHRYNRLLPLIIESDVKRPSILLPYVVNDYTRSQTREWFWKRLVDALKADIGTNSHYTGDRESLPFPKRAPVGIPPPSYRSNSSSSSVSSRSGGENGNSRLAEDTASTASTSSVFTDMTSARSASSPSLSTDPMATSSSSATPSINGSTSISGSSDSLPDRSKGKVQTKEKSVIYNFFRRKPK